MTRAVKLIEHGRVCATTQACIFSEKGRMVVAWCKRLHDLYEGSLKEIEDLGSYISSLLHHVPYNSTP